MANFFFTTCPGPCLRMNAKMMELQEALKGDHANVPLVSFSVYPEQDTPEVLRRYAERFKALPDRWFFLTGERSKIYDVAKKGFMLITMEAPGEGGKPPEDGQFIHSTKFALVDRQGVVRHYYDSENTEVVQHVLSDSAHSCASNLRGERYLSVGSRYLKDGGICATRGVATIQEQRR